MIATITFAFDMDDLLDALDLELVEDEEYDFEIECDEDGILWFYDDEVGADYYFDEDLDDWAEVTEDGTVWYLDEETNELYYFDDEVEDWIEVE